MRRVHGTMGFRRFEQLLIDDRRRRFATGEDGYLPHAAADPNSEVSTWPFPETYETFLELKQREAPAYENRSTIESAAGPVGMLGVGTHVVSLARRSSRSTPGTPRWRGSGTD